jgi:hypothetical protein
MHKHGTRNPIGSPLIKKLDFTVAITTPVDPNNYITNQQRQEFSRFTTTTAADFEDTKNYTQPLMVWFVCPCSTCMRLRQTYLSKTKLPSPPSKRTKSHLGFFKDIKSLRRHLRNYYTGPHTKTAPAISGTAPSSNLVCPFSSCRHTPKYSVQHCKLAKHPLGVDSMKVEEEEDIQHSFTEEDRVNDLVRHILEFHATNIICLQLSPQHNNEVVKQSLEQKSTGSIPFRILVEPIGHNPPPYTALTTFVNDELFHVCPACNLIFHSHATLQNHCVSHLGDL